MRIVLCYPVEPDQLAQLRAAAPPEAELVDAGQERIAEELPRADLFFGHAKVPVDWDAVVSTGRLRWIQSSAAGLDHCLTPPVLASPAITVTSASGLFADQVAEQAMALILGLVRSFPRFARAQQRKEFVRRPTRDLHGMTVGIIGLGGNGRRLAEVLAPWRVRMLGTDFFPEVPVPGVEVFGPEGLERVLGESDLVVLSLPLNATTHHLIDAAALESMKPGSFLVNVARGPVVKEADLIAALERGHLAGAGLDVTEVEPLPVESPLWELPQVLITPHVGAQSARRVAVTTEFICRNLVRYRRHQPLWNRVDKQLGFPRPAARPPSDWLAAPATVEPSWQPRQDPA